MTGRHCPSRKLLIICDFLLPEQEASEIKRNRNQTRIDRALKEIELKQEKLKLDEVGHGLAQDLDSAPRDVAVRLQQHPPLSRDPDVVTLQDRLLHQVTPALGPRAQQVVRVAQRPPPPRGCRGGGGGGGRTLLHESLDFECGRRIKSNSELSRDWTQLSHEKLAAELHSINYLEGDGGLGPLRGSRGAADDDARRTPFVHGRVLVEDDGAEVARGGGGGFVVAPDAADGAAALQMVERRLAERRLDARRGPLVLLKGLQ